MENRTRTHNPQGPTARNEGEFPRSIPEEGKLELTNQNLEILLQNKQLLEAILDGNNMRKAWQAVSANQGAAGIDGLSIAETKAELHQHWASIKASIMLGKYRPKAPREVRIPKSSGGTRKLSIPTVIDRLIQQAIAQKLSAYIDGSFAAESYGYRPNRSARQAVRQAKQYIDEGYEVTLDLDIEDYFGTVNQDRLISELRKLISDQRVISLIRSILTSNGKGGKGLPQGGPLSPLLSNLYLDPLDKELKARGHKFVRYADDCRVFLGSEKSGERVYRSIEKFLRKKLRLKLNEKKSGFSKKCKFLGFELKRNGVSISPEAVKRLKDKVRGIVKIRGGKAVSRVLQELKPILMGWNTYYNVRQKAVYKTLNSWINRRVRAMIYKSMKNGETRYKFFKRHMRSEHVAYRCAYSNYGPWSMALCKPMRIIYSGVKLVSMGLYHLR